MTIIAFILGSMFGGLISTVLLCCMQISSAESRKQEQTEKEKYN